MNTQTQSLLWTPCSQSVFTFDSDIHVPWGNKYTDPFTPVNTLFTKCIHIVLTVACQDDLLALKVTNELHHISIKRGIQILRLNGFNPGCLRRRPFPEEVSQQFIFSCLHCDPLPHPFYTPAPTRPPPTWPTCYVCFHVTAVTPVVCTFCFGFEQLPVFRDTALENLKCWGARDSTCRHTAKDLHHQCPSEESCYKKKKRSTFYLEKARMDHHQF